MKKRTKIARLTSATSLRALYLSGSSATLVYLCSLSHSRALCVLIVIMSYAHGVCTTLLLKLFVVVGVHSFWWMGGFFYCVALTLRRGNGEHVAREEGVA